MKKLILLLTVFLLRFQFAEAGAYKGNPVTNAVETLGYMQGAPFRFEAAPMSPDAFLAGGLLTSGILIYSLDGQIRHMAAKNKTHSLDTLAKQAEKIGNGGYELALLGVGAASGWMFKNDKLFNTSVTASESFLAANLIGTVLKMAVGRSRPYGEGGKSVFKPFSFKTVYTSFPSGHTTSAFSIASVIASRYNNIFAFALSYGAATATGLQRIYSDKHWASDVFAGAVLGTVTGLSAVRLSDKREESVVALMPVIEPGLSGARFVFRF